MRDILFRGKRMDNGEWVEGFYAGDTGDGCHEICDINSGTGHRVEVDPATVGQYTGLTDKNGKRIFEGDKLKPFDDEIDKMVVEFHCGTFMLCLYGERGYPDENGEWCSEGNYGVFECEPLSSYGDDVEIIGNIHDNPELLETEKNTKNLKNSAK